jgi:histone deacetylase complex subunit SAP18
MRRASRERDFRGEGPRYLRGYERRDRDRERGWEVKPPEPIKVDREKTTPMLIRVFTKLGGHHIEDTDYRDKTPPPDEELQIYTWKDCTLRELVTLIKQERPAARQRNGRLSIAFVSPDKNGRMMMRYVAAIHAHRPSREDEKTLHELRYEPGDYIDVAILLS